MRPVRWGILGTGRVADQFTRDLPHAGNAEAVAVTSRSAGRAADFAARHGLARSYGDYSAMLADPAVDAVYVATPHSRHFPDAAAALAAGKPVLCEKPLAVTPEECRALVAHARARRVYLLEGMWTYFLPAVRKAVEWVRAGRIGPLVQLQADFGYPQRPYHPRRREYDADLGGGCLLELGIYPVALAWLVTRADPDDIDVSCRRAPNGVEDDIVMVWRYPGTTATLGASFRAKLRNWACLVGEQGYIVLPDFWRAREALHFRLDECVEHFRDGRASLGFCLEAAAASDDIRAGRLESAVVPLSDSLRFQDHLLRVRQAADPARPVAG